jgi:hypothetical protein
VYRAVVGTTVQLPGRWSLETALLYSETQTEDKTFNNLSRPQSSLRSTIRPDDRV